MPGKSKDNKANKGRKALENEWALAVAAAAEGVPVIASSSNVETIKMLSSGGDLGDSNYVKQRAGASARERARLYEESLARKEMETKKEEQEVLAGGISAVSIECDESLDEKTREKLALKAKKKAGTVKLFNSILTSLMYP